MSNEQRYRLLLRMTLDELEELAETARLRGVTVLATSKRVGGDVESARLEARQLAVVSAQIAALTADLIRQARVGALVEVDDGVRLDD